MVCSPCRAEFRGYVPAHDSGFDDLLIAVFRAHPSQPVDPVQALALSPTHRHYVRDRIRRNLRARGYDIRAVGNRGAYYFDPRGCVYTQTPRATKRKRPTQKKNQPSTPTVTPPPS